MTNLEITQAIQHLCPNAIFTLLGDDYADLNWIDDRPKPTEAEIEAAYAEMVAANIDPLTGPNWEALREQLVVSDLFRKCYATAKGSLPIKCAFDKVEQVVLVTRIEAALDFFLHDLAAEMGDRVSATEIAEVNKILTETGFKVAL